MGNFDLQVLILNMPDLTLDEKAKVVGLLQNPSDVVGLTAAVYWYFFRDLVAYVQELQQWMFRRKWGWELVEQRDALHAFADFGKVDGSAIAARLIDLPGMKVQRANINFNSPVIG